MIAKKSRRHSAIKSRDHEGGPSRGPLHVEGIPPRAGMCHDGRYYSDINGNICTRPFAASRSLWTETATSTANGPAVACRRITATSDAAQGRGSRKAPGQGQGPGPSLTQADARRGVTVGCAARSGSQWAAQVPSSSGGTPEETETRDAVSAVSESPRPRP